MVIKIIMGNDGCTLYCYVKQNGGMAQQPEKKTDLAVEWLHFRRNPGVKVLQISHQIF